MAHSKDIICLSYTEFTESTIKDILNTVASSYGKRISKRMVTPFENLDLEHVEKVKFEANQEEVTKQLQIICHKVRSKWNVEKIAIYHRLGEVSLSQPYIIAAVSATQKLDESIHFILEQIELLDSIKIIIDDDSKSINDRLVNEFSNGADIHFRHDFDDSFFVSDTEVKINKDLQSGFNHDSVNNKIDPIHIQSHCTKEIEKQRIKSLCDYTLKKRNAKNMKKNSTVRWVQDQSGDETSVCARVNIEYHNTNIVRRVNNKWSDQHVPSIDSELDVISLTDEKSLQAVRTLGIYKPVARDIYERIKNIEDRLALLDDIDPRYKFFLRTEKCQKCFEKKLNIKSVDQKINPTLILDERLSPIELILGINKPVPRDVYERLEKMESQLLYLEGQSPGYMDLSIIETCKKCSENEIETRTDRKRTYSSSDEDR